MSRFYSFQPSLRLAVMKQAPGGRFGIMKMRDVLAFLAKITPNISKKPTDNFGIETLIKLYYTMYRDFIKCSELFWIQADNPKTSGHEVMLSYHFTANIQHINNVTLYKESIMQNKNTVQGNIVLTKDGSLYYKLTPCYCRYSEEGSQTKRLDIRGVGSLSVIGLVPDVEYVKDKSQEKGLCVSSEMNEHRLLEEFSYDRLTPRSIPQFDDDFYYINDRRYKLWTYYYDPSQNSLDVAKSNYSVIDQDKLDRLPDNAEENKDRWFPEEEPFLAEDEAIGFAETAAANDRKFVSDDGITQEWRLTLLPL